MRATLVALLFLFAVVVSTGVGYAAGVQVQRFTRCEQLSNQYIGAMAMRDTTGDLLAFKRNEINATRAAYHTECDPTSSR